MGGKKGRELGFFLWRPLTQVQPEHQEGKSASEKSGNRAPSHGEENVAVRPRISTRGL